MQISIKRFSTCFLILATAACSSSSASPAASSAGGTSAAAGASGVAGGSGAGGTSSTGGAAGAGGSAATGDPTASAVAAAQAFLGMLDAAQTAKVSFTFDDAGQRATWSNFPTGIFQRNGLRLGDLTDAQQKAAFALLQALLSAKGYQQVIDNVNADEALKQSSSGGMLQFGYAEHYVSILGTPSATAPWMVQFGGHHLAINVTIVGPKMTIAPSLTGAQPSSFTLNGATVRPVGNEVDKAFALMGALSADQQAKAIVGAQYMDLALGPGKDGMTLAPEGIAASELSSALQAQLVDLIAERVGIINDVAAAARLADVQSNLSTTYFAWSGPTAPGSAVYFRITGPTLVIEFAPQSLGGDAMNHIHSMYREPTNDYGKAWAP